MVFQPNTIISVIYVSRCKTKGNKKKTGYGTLKTFLQTKVSFRKKLLIYYTTMWYNDDTTRSSEHGTPTPGPIS